MKTRLTDPLPAAFVAASVITVFAPQSTKSQQEPPTPVPSVTAIPPAETTGDSGELEKVTLTGYIIPRVGDGTQPVTTLDQDFISKQADQTVSDVLGRLPESVGMFNPITTAGNSSSPGSAAVGLKGLPFNATLVLVDGIRFPAYPFAINSTTTGPISFVDLNSFPRASVLG